MARLCCGCICGVDGDQLEKTRLFLPAGVPEPIPTAVRPVQTGHRQKARGLPRHRREQVCGQWLCQGRIQRGAGRPVLRRGLQRRLSSDREITTARWSAGRFRTVWLTATRTWQRRNPVMGGRNWALLFSSSARNQNLFWSVRPGSVPVSSAASLASL